MVLIYTDSEGNEYGVLKEYKMEHEESVTSKNCTFEIQCNSNINLDIGSYVYSEGTLYGGRIEKSVVETVKNKRVYSGHTWRGLLSKKILCPDSGDDYLILSGDLNTIISTLITRCDYTDKFSVSADATISLTNYQFDRYATLLDGITKMLKENDYKLSLSVSAGVCTLAAVPITDYSNNYEITDDRFNFKLAREGYTCNHIIALGSGELSARTVVEKYVLQDGTIGDVQYYTGSDEVVEILDNPNSESSTELESEAIQALQDAKVEDGISVTANNIEADIGDKIQADDLFNGVSVTQYVTDVIVTINEDIIKRQYKVGIGG